MKRFWIILLLATTLPLSLSAQKKEIAAAKDLVKSGKNLSTAQANMEKLLTDSLNRGNKKIWCVLYDAIQKQYEQTNEKMYLKQNADTASLFKLVRQLFMVAGQLDSVEMVPNKKGKVELEYRKEHVGYLSQIRRNLYAGGMWFAKKHQYKDAYNMFDQYIVCASKAMFSSFKYQHNDKLLPTAAYWAVYCGYKLKDAKATLHHSYEALKDTAHYNYMLQYLAETYKLEKDTARYVQTLHEGFEHSPKFPFFFPRLVEYYAAQGDLEAAMKVVDKALAIDPENGAYLFTKSSVLLSQKQNQESAEISEKLIARGDSLPDLYYNAGIAYFNMAVELDKNNKNLKNARKVNAEIQTLYQKALPHLATYRRLAPQEQEKWALPLYTIYLNLNMGTEFDEIDKIIRKGK